jgi:long-subunit acyl-CoA synthetase (AMP-forming)
MIKIRRRKMGRKKTERVYTPLESMSHFAKKIASFGDNIAYRYFDKDRNLLSITYKNLSRRIHSVAAGFASVGLAGKRIAIIGETSVDWICAYVASVASGGVAIPLDKELDVNELSGFLEFAEADAIVYSATFNEKFKNIATSHPTVSRMIPLAPVKGTFEDNDRILPFEELLALGETGVANGYQYPRSPTSTAWRRCSLPPAPREAANA